MVKIERLPIAPEAIKHGALIEVEHISHLVEMLSPSDWSRPSAVTGWTVGEVVAHLDVIIGMYGSFLGTTMAGGFGSRRTAKLVGWFTSAILPPAVPAFDAVNATIPNVMYRLLTREQLSANSSPAHNALVSGY
jgi:hypothetical protein